MKRQDIEAFLANYLRANADDICETLDDETDEAQIREILEGDEFYVKID